MDRCELLLRDADYLTNLNVPLVAGRFYRTGMARPIRTLLFSMSAVSAFHFATPLEAIGEEIIIKRDSSRKQIIGVVRDYNHQLLMQDMAPMAIINNPGEFNILQVSYTGTFEDAASTIEVRLGQSLILP